MSLTKHITDLSDILTYNVELYDEMAEHLEQERKAFKSHSIGNLNENLKRKETIVLKIRTLEETRQRVLKLLAKVVKIDRGELTLTKLIELASDPLKERLISIHRKLKAAIERTNELNYYNRGLIEKLMRINYDAAAYLQNLIEPEETYARSGISPVAIKSGRVVKQTF